MSTLIIIIAIVCFILICYFDIRYHIKQKEIDLYRINHPDYFK